MEALTTRLSSKVESGNLLTVLDSTASEFKHFEVAYSALLLNCAKVLQKNIRGEADKYQFLLDQHAGEKGLLALELCAIVKTLPALECENCKEEECRNGQVVARDKFREGLKVKPNTSVTSVWGDRSSPLRFLIVGKALGDTVRVKREGSQSYDVFAYYDGQLTLCYNC